MPNTILKTTSFQTLRRKPILAAGLAIAMLCGTFYHLSTAESRKHRKAAERAAAAHVRLMASLPAAVPAPRMAPSDNAAAAVLRAASASTSGLAFVPESD